MQQLLVSSITPRPIAFVSTIDSDGNRNLSPFSFFNAFGANPATLIFSPARRGRDNTTKDTLENIKLIPEAVISIVSFEMVEQMSLSSSEFPSNVDEFDKAGFTPIKAELVKPFLLAESPVQFECSVIQVIELGTEGGAGNLVICEIIQIHIKDSVLNAETEIDPNLLRSVGRLGGNLYCKAFDDAIFEVAKPSTSLGIGIDKLPESIRFSKVLTGNDLGKLGNQNIIPTDDEILEILKQTEIKSLIEKNEIEIIHLMAKLEIEQNNIEYGFKLLMATDRALTKR